MRKMILPVLALSAVLVGTTACAGLSNMVSGLVPKIEAELGRNGVGVNVDAKLDVSGLCLDADGKVVTILNKIPFFGSAIVDLLPACAVEETVEAAPEA